MTIRPSMWWRTCERDAGPLPNRAAPLGGRARSALRAVMNPGAPDAGLTASLRRLAGTLLEVARVRLELLSTEFESEKLRIFDAIVLVALAFMFATTGLALAVTFIVLLMPPEWRAVTLATLALACIAAAVGLALHARRRLASPAGPIPATVDELRRDRAEFISED